MKSLSTRLRGRRLTIIVIAGFILSAFLGIFYFYYVPANKENFYKYAFLLLGNIKTAIREKNSDVKKVYLTYLNKSSGTNIDLQNSLQTGHITGTISDSFHISTNDSIGAADKKDTSGVLENITAKNLSYRFYSSARRRFVGIDLATNDFLQPLFHAHRKELFADYLLLKIDGNRGSVIYKNRSLDIGDNVNADSLFSSLYGLSVPDTKSMQLKGINYQLFYMPMSIDNQALMVCGLVKKEVVISKQYQIPAAFIYPFAIALLLLLISLPSLKFYIMGPEEEVRFKDLLYFVFSVFTGSCIITLVIIQVILLGDGEVLAKENLHVLSSQIDSAFSREVKQAYTQLDHFDKMAAVDSVIKSGNFEKIKEENYVSNGILKKYLREVGKDSSLYFGFDRVAWADSTGRQIMEGGLNAAPMYANVKDRKYFKAFHDNNLYHVPYEEDSLLQVEPVYNWINGEFRTIVSKRSLVDGMYIASVSTQMYSVYQNILPEGYGFCVIDANGVIQYSSDTIRNLRENFIEQLESPVAIREAITGNQQTYSDDATFYENNYFLRVKPTRDIPLYIVTYYDKGYIVPVNMRILIFALAFCAVSFVLYFLLSFAILWFRYYGRSFLYAPLCFFKWTIPQKKYATIYTFGALCLGVYCVMLILLLVFQNYWDISGNYVVLLIMLATPVNMLLLLFFLVKKKGLIAKLIVIGIYFIVSSFAYAAIPSDSKSGNFPFVLFQLFFMILLFICGFRLPERMERITHQFAEKKINYIRRYTWFVLLMIIVFAILPASLFTWYAHNHEITQSVKKQQLYLAQKVQARNNMLQKRSAPLAAYYPDEKYRNLLYKTGIYSHSGEKISVTDSFFSNRSGKNFDELYFSFSDEISNSYYKSEFYPALRDTSDNLSWRWNIYKNDSLVFLFKMLPQIQMQKTDGSILRIKSSFPERFVVLKANIKGYVLIAFIVLLLYGIFKHVSTVVRRVFLKRYLDVMKRNDWSFANSFPDNFMSNYVFKASEKEQILQVLGKSDSCSKLMCEDFSVTQSRVIGQVDVCGKWYHHIWKKLSDTEKNQVYNFAKNGLLNYKNVTDIYSLCKKGILVLDKEDDHLCLFHVSFRVYLLTYLETEQLLLLRKQFKINSAWKSFQTPLLIFLLIAAAFIFFTQQEAWQKIIALITGLSSFVPFLLNLFSKAGGDGGDKKAID